MHIPTALLALSTYAANGFVGHAPNLMPVSTSRFVGTSNTVAAPARATRFRPSLLTMKAADDESYEEEKESVVEFLERMAEQTHKVQGAPESEMTVPRPDGNEGLELPTEEDKEILKLSEDDVERLNKLHKFFEHKITVGFAQRIKNEDFKQLITSTEELVLNNAQLERVDYIRDSALTMMMVRNNMPYIVKNKDCFEKFSDWCMAHSLFIEEALHAFNSKEEEQTVYHVKISGSVSYYYMRLLTESIRSLRD